MEKRRPVLLIDGRLDSLEARDLLKKHGIEFARYDISKFAESCCGDLPTTKVRLNCFTTVIWIKLKG